MLNLLKCLDEISEYKFLNGKPFNLYYGDDWIQLFKHFNLNKKYPYMIKDRDERI